MMKNLATSILETFKDPKVSEKKYNLRGLIRLDVFWNCHFFILFFSRQLKQAGQGANLDRYSCIKNNNKGNPSSKGLVSEDTPTLGYWFTDELRISMCNVGDYEDMATTFGLNL